MPFVPDPATLVQFAIASVILAITPGPDMTLFVSRTLSQGRAAGFASMAGALAGTLVHTTLVVVGISALIVASPTAFLVLKIFGAGYLVYLAYQAIRYGSAFSPEKKTGPSISVTKSFSIGLGVNLMNPKIILFFMTFLPQFVSAQRSERRRKAVFPRRAVRADLDPGDGADGLRRRPLFGRDEAQPARDARRRLSVCRRVLGLRAEDTHGAGEVAPSRSRQAPAVRPATSQ